MGLKEDYRLKKLKKEMHRLHCEVKKCCDGEGGDGLTCDDLENCPEIIGIKNSIPEDISDLTDNSNLLFDGDYDSLSNKPTIPAVNDGQLELSTSGIATGGTKNFSANQSGNTTFTVDVPGTDITLSFNNNILTVSSSTGQSDSIDLSSLVTVDTYVVSMSLSGNTLTLTNNDGTTVQQDLSSILFDGDYNNLFNKPNIPTNTSELVNDSGYLACDDLEKCQEIINIKDSIPTIFIERSLPDLLDEIAKNALVPGATYKITGVHRAHTIDDFPLPINALYDDGRDLGTTIFLKAISENELETFGSGVFYNPKYNKQVQGFGIWSNTSSYNAGDIIFWGGYVWKNLNGNIGSSIDILSLDGEWEKLNYDDVNYNKVVDYIEYDIEKDLITRRYDTTNKIDVSSGFFDIIAVVMKMGLGLSPVSLMQWGNDLDFDLSVGQVGVGNVKAKHMSFAELINFKGVLTFNVTLDNSSYLSKVVFDNGSYLKNVTLNESRLENVTFDNESRLENVSFDNESRLENVTFDNESRLENVSFVNRTRLEDVTFDKESRLENVTFVNGTGLKNVTFDNKSYLKNVTFDNGLYLSDVVVIGNSASLSNVTFFNESGLENVSFVNRTRLEDVTFDNSRMTNNTFINFVANFNNQTYSNLQFSNIKFEGNGGATYTMPDISMATIITDPNIPQKKVFGVDSTSIKIQFWDVAQNDFVVADITD